MRKTHNKLIAIRARRAFETRRFPNINCTRGLSYTHFPRNTRELARVNAK
jgi:hypothetical protein